MSSTKRNYMVLAAVSALLLCAGLEYAFGPKLHDITLALAAEKDHGHTSEDAHDHEEGKEHKKSGHGDHDESGHGDEEDGHDDESGDHEDALQLSPEDMLEFGITLAAAGPGLLEFHTDLPGEVRLNEDHLAHVVPNITGVVREVTASLGDSVKAGDVMAVLASRELAETKAAHLSAHAQLELLEVTFQREKQLWEDKISAEQSYLEARNAVANARITLRVSEERLYALGLPAEIIHQIGKKSRPKLTRFEVRAPFEGTVIEKHITHGEALEATTPIFVVADLSTVWVDLSVYAKDLLSVRKGQKVIISSGVALPDAEGIISYIGPVVGEETRTAMARVVLPNPDGLWKPGLFITASVAVDELNVPIKVPKTALHTIEGKTHVFVKDLDGFEVTEVKLG
ncbi:MAG: efflux RND transporter periplasmic adaptor subunit, partial [Candidatus Hydrogenedentes bacterium]|nr:efflux RND transporter periplasmic adaptor subunit [Candidatus Hydrogenedentota bacterium]